MLLLILANSLNKNIWIDFTQTPDSFKESIAEGLDWRRSSEQMVDDHVNLLLRTPS